MRVDTSRDEIRFAGIKDDLAGRWRFAEPVPASETEAAVVDVDATNEVLVLNGRRLSDFVGIHPDDPKVPHLEELPPPSRAIAPAAIAVILLCGGMSSRSGGKIHPLLQVEDSGRRRTPTLLDLKLEILAQSPLAQARRLVVASLLNEGRLREHLQTSRFAPQVSVYAAGLAPLLAVRQRLSGPPAVSCNRFGEPTYVAAGHLDALRWLVVSGTLATLQGIKVLLLASYSNWGRIFTPEALLLAGRVAEFRQGSDTLFILEVITRPRHKKTGSLLVEGPGDLSGFRLVKYGFGGDAPRLPEAGQVLMSTNTLYVNLENLMTSLVDACPQIGLAACREDLDALLREARQGSRRAEACALFDAAFPIRPVLTHKATPEGLQALQAERFLDQLALLPGPTHFEPVRVPPERGVSIKLLADLEDPKKRAYLFS